MDDLILTETWQANAMHSFLKRNCPPSDDIIPDGIRAIRRVHGGYRFILEIEPGVHNVMWAEKQRRLSMPYIIFVGHVTDAYQVPVLRNSGFQAEFLPWLENIGTFFRNEPIKSLDDRVCYAVLRNTFARSMCGAKGILKNNSLTDAVNFLRQALFAKAYNWDSENATNYMAFTRPGSGYAIEHLSKALFPISRWEENSLKDPQFGLKVDWPRTLGSAPTQSLRWYLEHPHLMYAAENHINQIFVRQALAKLQQT